MDSELEALREAALAEIGQGRTRIDLENLRVRFLGKSGAISSLSENMRNLPKEDVLSEEVTQQRRNLMWARGAVLTLLILTAAAIWQAHRATVAQHLAETQRDRAQRALNQVVATADRSVLALSLRLQEDASRADRVDRPTAPIIPHEPGVDGLDHTLKDALEQTKQSTKLLANGDRWEREIARNLELDAPYR